MRCIDIGSSTGGFTDCLLQAGAAHVACVDVNYGQLAWKIRQDERVSVFERTNIKTADPADLGAPFDLIVIDVSFIGLAALAGTFPPLLPSGLRLGICRGRVSHGVHRPGEAPVRVSSRRDRPRGRPRRGGAIAHGRGGERGA